PAIQKAEEDSLSVAVSSQRHPTATQTQRSQTIRPLHHSESPRSLPAAPHRSPSCPALRAQTSGSARPAPTLLLLDRQIRDRNSRRGKTMPRSLRADLLVFPRS